MSISATSLPDALCQVLRANTACATAFGDTWVIGNTIAQNQAANNVCKFWADYADQIVLPYLVFMEIGERYDFMSRTGAGLTIVNFTSPGNLICKIIGAGRSTLRALGILVCNAINDCDEQGVTWGGFESPPVTCTLMNIRMGTASFVPDPNVGPGVPAAFNRVIGFDYEYQGQIG